MSLNIEGKLKCSMRSVAEQVLMSTVRTYIDLLTMAIHTRISIQYKRWAWQAVRRRCPCCPSSTRVATTDNLSLHLESKFGLSITRNAGQDLTSWVPCYNWGSKTLYILVLAVIYLLTPANLNIAARDFLFSFAVANRPNARKPVLKF